MIPFLEEVPLLKDPYGAKSRWLAQLKVVMQPKRNVSVLKRQGRRSSDAAPDCLIRDKKGVSELAFTFPRTARDTSARTHQC